MQHQNSPYARLGLTESPYIRTGCSRGPVSLGAAGKQEALIYIYMNSAKKFFLLTREFTRWQLGF